MHNKSGMWVRKGTFHIVMAPLFFDLEEEDEAEPGPSDMETQGSQECPESLVVEKDPSPGSVRHLGHDQPDCQLPT